MKCLFHRNTEMDERTGCPDCAAAVPKDIPVPDVLQLDHERRINQLGINCRWLIDMIDQIHEALCPESSGTWQMRAEQAVEAADKKREMVQVTEERNDTMTRTISLSALKKLIGDSNCYCETCNLIAKEFGIDRS